MPGTQSHNGGFDARRAAAPDECPAHAFPSSLPRGHGVDPILRTVHETGGVAKLQYPFGHPAWVVTGYKDVQKVSSSSSFDRSGMKLPDAPRMTKGKLQGQGIGSLDDEEHSRIRTAITRALHGDRLIWLREHATATMESLLASASEAGECDYVAHIARPFSLSVLGDLLGIDAGYFDRICSWVDLIMAGHASSVTDSEIDQAIIELGCYVIDLVEAARLQQDGGFIKDLIDDSSDLNMKELITIVFGLIVGGFESSAHTLAQAVHLLLMEPELTSRLRQDPSMVPAAVDEMLRVTSLSGGVTLVWTAREDVELSGYRIRKGDYVIPAPGMANRDPVVFPDPERIDFDRDAAQQLSLGYGRRYCLGAKIARMQLEVGIGRLAHKYPDARLQPPSQVSWREDSSVWQIASLPVAVGQAI